jgi:SAM-dependent methyltransferase
VGRIEEGDAFGRLVRAWHEGERVRVQVIVERDDGFIEATGGAASYFAPPRRWPACERRALRLARGRVLDVGVGPGRVALELQRRGHEVVGIDPSPLAIEVARARGMTDARIARLEEVDERLGTFDTVVMYGNNFGLLRSPTWAPRLLRRLARVTSPRARVLAGSNDPHGTDDPGHLAYQERNRARGRLAGQLRLRVRYRDLATPWFEYLIVSADEMAELAASGGWRLARVVPNDQGSYFVGVLEKAAGGA